ncbi:hypothetical protein [Labrys monachus]|uniref:Uncharacterized protein n=1 Tax=Labrys monachus TaxID=217067 RepID=A0ABU0FNS9_9HYPH|nr:hypothetical protein [Labrys monachus]MDQ0396262.1 hypothetical protein [Labrys monachus]
MEQIAIRSHCRLSDRRAFTPLPALGREAPDAASRFRRWRGASGKSYLVSVYPIGECPDYVDAVLIAVDAASGARVWIGEAGTGGAGLAATLSAAARAGASEVHVHLLAGDEAGRLAAILDLGGRH